MKNRSILEGASILVTGGTGSFGRAFVQKVLSSYDISRLIVFSRDELKQFEMQQDFNESELAKMRFFLGDVRDIDRLKRAFNEVDIVVHAAALKQVVAAEYNPTEFIKTNVIGAQNVIESCLFNNVKRVVALSTDKAAAPINLYGASKLCSDKLFVSANNIRGKQDIRFSVTRYGNVMGSRGSVIPFFLGQKHTGRLPITHPEMTRFNISLDEGVNMVLWAIDNAKGGEILVPKIPSYRITDLAEAVCSECEKHVIGIRPGEKIHEEMITASDSHTTVDLGKYYAILENESRRVEYCEQNIGSPVPLGFSYSSGQNPEFLTVPELRSLIEKYRSGVWK